METFIRSIQPCILKKVNKNRRIDEKYQKLIEFNKYLFGLKKLKQRGYDEFIKNYTDREKISAEYRTWTVLLPSKRFIYLTEFKEREAQEKLALELGLKSHPEKKKEENTKLFEAEHSHVFKHKNRLTLGAKLLGFDDNKNLSNDHIKILKKQQILVSSASSSYSELFKNPNLLKEQSQQPKRTNSFQIVSTPPQQNSLSVQIESRNRSRSVDLDDRIPNREEIVINSQEEYIFQGLDLFTVKREEIMDEENAVITDCFPNRSENLGRTVKNSSQTVREFEKGKVLANNMMDIEFNEEHLRDEEMLIEDNNLPRTTISVLHNQMDEELEDEKESIHPRESKSRLSRKRSILKKNFTNDFLSERLSLSSRSNSRSEKRVRFEGISDEDEEGEEKDNELEERISKKNDEKNQDPRKSQISIISKLLQKRLEKEEQSRGITNLLNMSPQTNIIEKNNTVEEKKLSEIPEKQFGLGSKEKSQGTLSKPFVPPLNVKQKDSPNTSTSTLASKANQIKQITETHSTSNEERKDSINMSELWKSINTSSSRSDNNSKKKVPSYNPDRSRLSFFASAPSLDLNSKTQKQSNDIAKKSPLSSLSKSFEISHVQEAPNDAALEGKKKVQIPANTSKIIPKAGNDNTVQPLVTKNNGLQSSGTNKANTVDVSTTRTLVTNYNTLKPPVEDKAVSMRSTSPASDTTYDNSKSFNHEVEEFLKKTRQKRQEESLQTEEIKEVAIPQALEVSLSNYSSSLRDESDNQGVNFTHPRAEDRRSKLRLKNADNVDITLEFDDNLYNSRVIREPKGKSHQPVNRIVTESQEEESDEYEEIIVIRRKRNSVVRNEPISVERESNYNPVVNRARPGDESKSLPMPLPQSDTVRELNYSTRPAGDNLLRSTSHTHMKSNQIANNHPNHTGVNTHSEGLRQPLEQTQLLETPSKKPLEKKASISSEKSVDTVRRILDKKSNSNASIEAVPVEKELYNNARGSELVQLSTKLNRKKNLIEEDDPDDESLNFDFDGESADIKQAFSRNAKSYELVKTTQRRKSNYRTSKTLPQAESPKATKKLKARPLVSFPNGVVITQSEHIRRMKKEKLAKGAAINLNPEISDALSQLFSIFIDKRALV